VHGRCGELAALTALRDIFGIRDRPDIGPSRRRPPATIPALPRFFGPNGYGARSPASSCPAGPDASRAYFAAPLTDAYILTPAGCDDVA